MVPTVCVCVCVCLAEPGFYSTNWLFIGKCHLQLGRVQEGGEWLKKAAAHKSEVAEDVAAKQEAIQILKKLTLI